MPKKSGRKVVYSGKSRVEYVTNSGAKYIIMKKKKVYETQYRSRATGAKRGRPKGSTKTRRKTSTRGRGRPAKSGIQRYKSGRPKYTAAGSKRGRPRKTVSDIPKSITVMSSTGSKRYKLSSIHRTKRAAQAKAPKEHRIRKIGGKYALYLRGR